MISVALNEYQRMVRALRWAEAWTRLRGDDGGASWNELRLAAELAEAEYRQAAGLSIEDWERDLLREAADAR